jgi:hypothetical protein
VTTAGRRSHAILGLARSFTEKILGMKAESPVTVSGNATADTLVPDVALPRPPFTLTATLFGALRASLFEARMLLVDFCNCTNDVRATNPSSRFLAGTVAMTTFLFLRITHDLPELAFTSTRSGDTRRAAHASGQS